MAIFSQPWRAIAVIVLAALMAIPALAADIALATTKGGISRIVVDGPITKGDYERLLDAILSAGVDIDTVALSSPGGDALEAMRLGRLIRSFGLRAEAPKRFTAQTVCPIGLNKQIGCSCDSACLFLYLGAVHRYGDALGVHRLYLNPEIQRKLSLEESKKFAKMLGEATKQYFEEMHAPTSLLEQVNSAASDSVRYLTNDYVEQNLHGYSRDSEDWLIAKCGSASRAFARFYRSSRAPESEKAIADYNKIKTCFNHHLRGERLRIFPSALQKALEGVDQANVAPNSLLSYAKASPSVFLADLIGRPIDSAARSLATLGFGLIDSKSMKAGEGYVLKRTLTLSTSSDGTVRHIDVTFYGEPGDDARPFTGQFIKGFDLNSTPQDLVAKYGKPLRQGRIMGGETALLDLESAEHDVRVVFGVPKNKLRAVTFNAPGYLSSVRR
jgi:hypothetical protein